MNRVRGRITAIVAGAFVVAALVATPSAQAAVTTSHITTPSDLAYMVYNQSENNTFAVSGTTNGTTGDHVDIVCYYGTSSRTVASNVAVAADGSFSVPAASLQSANVYSPCTLRAIPSGTTPADLSPFAGPRVLVGYNRTYAQSGGPNDGKLYDFYAFFQQLAGGMDWDSISSCGVDDGYLVDSTFARTTTTFYCNAALFDNEANPGTRSELQIDGVDAWPTWSAHHINNAATGVAPLTYSYTVDPHTGVAVIHETEPFVKCADHTYPPTALTCASFVSAGVTDQRTITQDHDGHMAWITDTLTSTDGKAHQLDLLWDNEQRFYRTGGDSTQLEYRFPGQSSYSLHVLNDSVSLPAAAGTIYIRMHGSADGNTATGQGAIVYDRPATAAKFVYVASSYERFTLHQTATVPTKGALRIRFAYVQAFQSADVASLAKYATAVFKGCTVPKVIGKSLSKAKPAITHAGCAVGKITHAFSSKVKKNAVISEKPKAGSHVAYKAKVALVVSKGKKK